MADISLLWGGDFSLTSSGDYALASDVQLANQRLIRRLLTRPGTYLWHPFYGAGLAQYIGQARSTAFLVNLIRRQILMEGVVARNPLPTITVSQNQSTISVTINYFLATTGAPATLAFDVSPPNTTTGQ